MVFEAILNHSRLHEFDTQVAMAFCVVNCTTCMYIQLRFFGVKAGEFGIEATPPSLDRTLISIILYNIDKLSILL